MCVNAVALEMIWEGVEDEFVEHTAIVDRGVILDFVVSASLSAQIHSHGHDTYPQFVKFFGV